MYIVIIYYNEKTYNMILFETKTKQYYSNGDCPTMTIKLYYVPFGYRNKDIYNYLI